MKTRNKLLPQDQRKNDSKLNSMKMRLILRTFITQIIFLILILNHFRVKRFTGGMDQNQHIDTRPN